MFLYPTSSPFQTQMQPKVKPNYKNVIKAWEKKTLKAIDRFALCKPTCQKGRKESVCENDWFVFMFHHKLQKWNERHVLGINFLCVCDRIYVWAINPLVECYFPTTNTKSEKNKKYILYIYIYIYKSCNNLANKYLTLFTFVSEWHIS